MKPYSARIFKGSNVFKSTLLGGEPYKHRTFLMLTNDTNEVVVCQSRLVQSETQPDIWHTFVRTFNGKKYWNQVTGLRMEHYIKTDEFIINKINELSEQVMEIKNDG